MDTDDLPALAVLAVSLLLFAYFSLAQYAAAPIGSVSRSGTPYLRTGQALLWVRFACVIALAVSGFGIIRDYQSSPWWTLPSLSIGMMAALLAIDRLTSLATARRPVWSRRLLFPIFRIMGKGLDSPPMTLGDPLVRAEVIGDVPWEDPANGDGPVITEADLVNMDQRDREMLRSILGLDSSTAREIMVPRLDMMTVEVNSSLYDVADLMAQCGHSRIPVYEESIDHVVGIVHSRDVLAALAHTGTDQNLQSLMNPPFIIPESKRLDDLLEEFQEKGVQMAIVVDEYGGTEGLVTVEDLLEEIVGEIEDEFSRDREPLLEATEMGGVLVDARVPTNEVEELFGASINGSGVDTVGGYVYHSLGRIPVPGDVVTTDQLRIEVVSVLGRRLRKLRIHRISGDGLTTNG